MELLKKNWKSLIIFLFSFIYFLWWIWIQYLPDKTTNPIIHFFAGTYGFIALWGVFWGFNIMRHWGGMKSIIGKAIAMFSLGLLAQEFGQLIYAYYVIVQKIEIPYPSLGDVGYFGSIFFYFAGIYYIAKASGVKLSLKSTSYKILGVIFPIFMLGYSYVLFLKEYQLDFSKPVTTFLDFGYPLGQTLNISLALLTFVFTRKLLGGIMKDKIVILLFALLLQYLADFNFLFQSSRETWVTAGYGDLLYFIAYIIMTFALIRFDTAVKQIKSL